MEAAPTFDSKQAPPTHVAIIMDGNGRWAKARGLPRIAGHQQGAEVVRRTVKHCRDLGVAYLTIYAFSSENWKRPSSEVDDLMGLLRLYLERELEELARAGVRMRFIGDRRRLAGDIISLGTFAGDKQIMPGDEVELEIEKIGILRNTVVQTEAKWRNFEAAEPTGPLVKEQ